MWCTLIVEISKPNAFSTVSLDDDGHRRLLRHLLVQRHHQPPHIQNSRQISTNAPLRQQTYRSFVIRCNCRRRKWFKYKLFILLIYQSSSPSVFSHIYSLRVQFEAYAIGFYSLEIYSADSLNFHHHGPDLSHIMRLQCGSGCASIKTSLENILKL